MTGVRPDSVQALGGMLSLRLPARSLVWLSIGLLTAGRRIGAWLQSASVCQAAARPPLGRLCVRRTSSGSRASLNDVKLTRSQNSTEHTLRSATEGVESRLATSGAATAGATALMGAAISAAPQTRQNRLPDVPGVPQDGQGGARAFPHSSQKALPSSFCVEQDVHTNMDVA
jgi:hypothetical protein